MGLIASLLPTAGCPAPRVRLDDFLDDTKAIRDLPPPKEDLGAMLADISGTFILALDPSILPGLPLQFFVTSTFTPTPSGGSLNLDFQPLSLEPMSTTEPRLFVGDVISFTDIEVKDDGSFFIDFGNTTLVGEANPITGTEIVATLTMNGFIQSEDFICGLVNGMLLAPVENTLDGSTFGAVRMESADPAIYPVPATDEFPMLCP